MQLYAAPRSPNSALRNLKQPYATPMQPYATLNNRATKHRAALTQPYAALNSPTQRCAALCSPSPTPHNSTYQTLHSPAQPYAALRSPQQPYAALCSPSPTLRSRNCMSKPTQPSAGLHAILPRISILPCLFAQCAALFGQDKKTASIPSSTEPPWAVTKYAIIAIIIVRLCGRNGAFPFAQDGSKMGPRSRLPPKGPVGHPALGL